MSEHVPKRESATPGPRTVVQLDVSEASLPTLLHGIEAVRCWLSDEGDGFYSFHATQTLGQSREQAGEPAQDVLRREVNAFADLLDGEDVPQRLRDEWDAMVARYVAATKKDTGIDA